MLHGIDPSPRIGLKFKSPLSDPVNGNYFLNRFMGENDVRGLSHSKCFFGVQFLRFTIFLHVN